MDNKVLTNPITNPTPEQVVLWDYISFLLHPVSCVPFVYSGVVSPGPFLAPGLPNVTYFGLELCFTPPASAVEPIAYNVFELYFLAAVIHWYSVGVVIWDITSGTYKTTSKTLQLKNVWFDYIGTICPLAASVKFIGYQLRY